MNEAGLQFQTQAIDRSKGFSVNSVTWVLTFLFLSMRCCMDVTKRTQSLHFRTQHPHFVTSDVMAVFLQGRGYVLLYRQTLR